MKVNVHDPRGEELAQVLTRATAALARCPAPASTPSSSPRTCSTTAHAHAYSTPRSWGAAHPDQVAEYEALVTRRASREPLQHITGSAPSTA